MAEGSTIADRRIVTCSAGAVPLPITVEDGSQLGLLHMVDPKVARQLMPAKLVVPLTLFGKAIALVTAFEYRTTSISLYGEFGIGILASCSPVRASAVRALATPHRVEAAGWFIVNLPVTTELALASGIEIWGFPKYIRPITTEFGERDVRIVLDREIEITHRGAWRFSLRAAPIVSLTVFQGRILRTQIATNHRMAFGWPGSTTLRIIGDGPAAATATQLGLERRRPLIAFRVDYLRSSLPAGEFVKRDRA